MDGQSRVREKFVFVISVTAVIFLTCMMASVQWFLPYYYVICAPLLIALRIHIYIQLKRQYLLIDYCYFGNVALLLYLWLAPNRSNIFITIFGIANGPMAWASYFFFNCLAFHNVNKMTSVFIHTQPAFVTYVIRWYGDTVSSHWHTSFNVDTNVDFLHMCIWIELIPLVSIAAHFMLYVVIVYVIFPPDPSCKNSMRLLLRRGWQLALLDFCGPRCRQLMLPIWTCIFGVCSLLGAMLVYQYFVLHTLYIICVSLNVVWNAAVFYVDEFSVRGFRAKS